MRLFQHHPEQLAEHLPRPHGIGVRQRRALHRRRPNMIKPRLMALHAVHDLAQARRATELAIQQRDQLPLRGQLANQPVRPVLLHNPVKPRPRNVLRQTVEYAILMPHGVDFLPCPERVRSAQNTEESTSCTLSTKIEPDSSGLDPAIHPLRKIASCEDGWIRGSSPRMTTFVVLYAIVKTWQIDARTKNAEDAHAVSNHDRRLAAETGMAGRAQRAVGALEIFRGRACAGQ